VNDTTTTYSCARDYQLFGPGPKRVLALDGGGVRGAITVAFLEHIEAILCAHLGKETRLGDHFHLVGGTSTGAIIAGAIALGFRATQVKEFYTRLAPLAFKRQRWALPILQAKFDVRGLRGEIENIVGDLELQSDKLVTGLCVVSKRIDTGSPWIMANNPAAPFWEDGPDYDGNKYYKLANLVRASTAAPHFFDPELLPINSRKAQLPRAVAPRWRSLPGGVSRRRPSNTCVCARGRSQTRRNTACLSMAASRRTTIPRSPSCRWCHSSHSSFAGRLDHRTYRSHRSAPAPSVPASSTKIWDSRASRNSPTMR
jgi:patatin-like phospholipase/acyl hydrolase